VRNVRCEEGGRLARPSSRGSVGGSVANCAERELDGTLSNDRMDHIIHEGNKEEDSESQRGLRAIEGKHRSEWRKKYSSRREKNIPYFY